MRFLLFSKILFEIADPISLIECYCVQTDFYANYNLLPDRKIKNVNAMGARISSEQLRECKKITEGTRDLPIFGCNLNELLKLDDQAVSDIKKLNNSLIQKLLEINGIGLSRATKILHTLYPKIIPMIDNMYQEEYRLKINHQWSEKSENDCLEILMDYYRNLKAGDNLKNLGIISRQLVENNLRGLTEVAIFDIIWWSYLKSNRLAQKVRQLREVDLNLSSIKYVRTT